MCASSQALEFLLSNCPLLEQLCIRSCGEFIDLRITGSSLPLKHLQIYDAFLTRGFEIDAPNLSSFECDYSLDDEFKFGNTQKLTKLTIPASPSFLGICQYTPQLEELVIIIHSSNLPHVSSCFEGVELLRLKRAKLRVVGYAYYAGKNILHIISNLLLHGAPHLDMLKFDLGPMLPDMEFRNDCHEDDDVPTCHKHAFLKSVEIRCSSSKGNYSKETIRIMRNALKLLARKLEQKLPSRTQLLSPQD